MSSSHTIVRLALTSILVAVTAAQYGCQDTPTAPTGPGVPISKAVNAPGDSSAPETVFLAPLGPKHHPRGELDTTLAPAIAICRLNGDNCGADTLAHFSSDSSADSTLRIMMNERAFHVRWKIKDLPADTAIAYRIVVTLGDTTVGFTDLKIVAPDFQPLPDDTLRFAFIPSRNWLNIRFQIFMPPVTLTVIAEPGVNGDPSSQTYTYRRGDRAIYNFAADSGYTNVLVTLDQNPLPRRGRIIMNESHVLIASADRKTGVSPGDQWILHDAQALLKSNNKIQSAQQLLDKLDEMPDTVNIVARLRMVEMTVLARDADAAAMSDLDQAMDGHSFDAGFGDGSADDNPGGGGGGGGGVASSILVPFASPATIHPSASIMAPTQGGGEPVTIAYVNGILTTPLGALFAAHHVAMAARSAHWYANVPFDVKLIYNHSAMANETSTEDRCVLELGIKGDWLGLNSLPNELAKCLDSTTPKVLALLADYAEAGNELASVLNRSAMSRPHDVDTVAAFTTRMRDEGKHLIFVMHSQGNLVVQQALTLLRTRGEYSQARDTTCIAGVALASPTSQAWPISARHLHGLVVDGDAILMLGKNDFPRVRTPMSDSAARETTGSIRARIVGLATAASIRWGLRLHSAIQSYLTTEPIRGRIQDAMVASYHGCALGEVRVTPQTLQLQPGDTARFDVGLADLNGEKLDGRRGLTWQAESGSDWQRAVQLSPDGLVTARYVGGTSLGAVTRSIVGKAGVAIDPIPLNVTANETLSAIWAVIFMGESTQYPTPPFVIPETAWNGGSCIDKATFESNGRTGTFSKQCTAAYRVVADSIMNATKYQASFFEKGATAALFTVSGTGATLHGSVTGPSAILEPMPGPTLLDRIVVTAYDTFGHVLGLGAACAHGCVGW